MEFIYDTEAYVDEEEESLIIEYTNNVSVWAIFEEKKYYFEARLGDKVLEKSTKLETCDAFVRGMEAYAKNEGEFFTQKEVENIPEEVSELKKELILSNKEKEKAKDLASKLIKGIVKDKDNINIDKMNEIMEKHANIL